MRSHSVTAADFQSFLPLLSSGGLKVHARRYQEPLMALRMQGMKGRRHEHLNSFAEFHTRWQPL